MVKTISDVKISNKKVLLRADFDVSLTTDFTIADDARIRQNLATIKYLLDKRNKIICVAKLGRPKKPEPAYSLLKVVKKLQQYLPNYKVKLVADFLNDDAGLLVQQRENEILVLENIRFYAGEWGNEAGFAKKLASLADVYVNDAFAMCHRLEASVVGLPKYLPSYAGLQLAKEIAMIRKVIKKPKKPLVVIIGGAKVQTKLKMMGKLTELANYLLIGGIIAKVFLEAKNNIIGKKLPADQLKAIAKARRWLRLARQRKTMMVLPTDVVVGYRGREGSKVKNINQINHRDGILDIGPATQAEFGAIINKAKTIIWNGPMGYIENPAFRRGTDFIYYAITQNQQAVSLVGGGDTLAAIAQKEYLDKITHLSTGGGAMLEFIEKGTLPGIEALRQ